MTTVPRLAPVAVCNWRPWRTAWRPRPTWSSSGTTSCATPSARPGRRRPPPRGSWPSRRRRCTTPSTRWPAPTKSYLVDALAHPKASREAAVAAAAHRALVAFYPAQAAALDAKLTASLATIPDGKAEDDGVALGRSVADQILALRQNDGSGVVLPPYLGGTEPGQWRPTPPANAPGLHAALGGRHAVRHDEQRPVPAGRAAGARQRRVHGRLQRGQGTRLRSPAPRARPTRRPSPGSGPTAPAPRRRPAT